MEKREIDPNIAWVRAIACLLVVFGHTVQHISAQCLRDFRGFPLWLPTTLITRPILLFNNTAVPMFFMISGYLVFSRAQEFTYLSAWKRFLKLYIPIIYFGTLYYITDLFLGNYYPYYVIFLRWGSVMGAVVDFLYELLPVYILSLFMSLPRYTELKDKIRLLVVVMLLFVLTESSDFWPFVYPEWGIDFHTAFLFNRAFGYALTGFALKQFDAVRFPRSLKIGLWFGFIVLLIERLYPASDKYLHYSSLDIYLLSRVFFLALQSIDISALSKHPLGSNTDRFFQFIAKYSLGIFGWHGIFIWVTRYYLERNIISYTIMGHPVVTFLLALCFSILMSMADKFFGKKFTRYVIY